MTIDLHNTDALGEIAEEFAMSKFANSHDRNLAMAVEIARLRDLLAVPDDHVRIDFKISDELCMDFLTSCYEGGSAYWLSCQNVEREKATGVGCVVSILGCEDAEDEETKWGDATLHTIRTGIQRIMSGEVEVREDIARDVLACLIDYDNANWDAETTDTVLQAGLLGEITYG